MPLYEYQCGTCGKKFEVLQKFSDQPLSVHDNCGGPVTRLFSAPAFHLKGTGWYATDYAKSGSSGSSSASSKGDSTAGSDSKAESKPSAGTSTSDTKSSESKPTPASTDSK